MMIMNENMLNMLKELDSEFPDNYGLREGLRIDAIDLKDRYDDDIDFDEELLDELRIYYKNKTILIKRYDRDNWEIKDYDYLKFEDLDMLVTELNVATQLGNLVRDAHNTPF